MSDQEDDFDVGGEPPSIDPYDVLSIDKSATSDDIKKAYRKAALKHHPDKVPQEKKEAAHQAFQNIAFAYAVLSDPARRKRYDETGSTSESIVDSEGFNWSDFYRGLFKNAVSADAIEEFSKQYKASDEEKSDILAAYERHEGDMDGVYEMVMLSDVLEDDMRFRSIINEAIENGDVSSFPKYKSETKKTKDARIRRAKAEAKSEAKEAESYAKELGVHDKLFGQDKENSKSKGKGKGKGGKGGSSEDSLAALILQRQKDRSGDNFLDRLAEKYGAGKDAAKTKKSSSRKRASPDDEPPGEMFTATAARYKANKESNAGGESSGSRTRSKRAKR